MMLSIQREQIQLQPQQVLSRPLRMPCLRASTLLFLSGVSLLLAYHWQWAAFRAPATFVAGAVNILAVSLLLENCARFSPLSMVITISSAFWCVSLFRIQIDEMQLMMAAFNLMLIIAQLAAAAFIWYQESLLRPSS